MGEHNKAMDVFKLHPISPAHQEPDKEWVEQISKFRASQEFIDFMSDPAFKDSMYGVQILQKKDNSIIKRFILASQEALQESRVREESSENAISHLDRIIAEAVKSFCKMMQWRRDNDVDNALKSWTFDFHQINSLRPHQFQGFDMAGRPIYWEQLGKIDALGLEAVSSVDELVRYHIFHWEYITQVLLPIASMKNGKRVDQIITICDVSNINAGLLTASMMNLLGKIAEIDQFYYPETGFKLFLINTPWLFNTVWPIIAPFITPQGQDKIETVYGSPESVLLQFIDQNELPKCLGGNANDHELAEDERLYRRIVNGDCKLEFSDELDVDSLKK